MCARSGSSPGSVRSLLRASTIGEGQVTEDEVGSEPFQFPDDCQLCGASMKNQAPGLGYILGGNLSVPNDAGDTSIVCVCDACLRKHRAEHGPAPAETKAAPKSAFVLTPCLFGASGREMALAN